MKVLFLGSGLLGLSILEELVQLEKNGQIELVAVYPWSKTKKGKALKDDGEVKLLTFIRKHRLKMLACPGANHFEFNQCLQALKPDVVIVGCWGEILKPHLVQRKDIKLVNCHPSLLPAHRGANPYVSTIMMKEKETGVTFHWMGLGIDDGPVILQKSVPITPEDTGGALRDKCCAIVKEMVPTLVENLKTQTSTDGEPQEAEKSSYFKQITLADGLIYWDAEPSDVLCRLRALKPWLSCYSMLQGQLLYIFHQLTIVTRQECAAKYPSMPLLQGQVPAQIPPGTIVAKAESRIWIQSSSGDVLFETDDYQFYMGIGFLPKFFSLFFSRHMIKVGYRFLQAFVQGVVSQSQ
jgi:methionyl-tRNA formyltransferase